MTQFLLGLKKRKNKADKNAKRRHIIVNIIAFCSQDSGVLCRGADLINLLASCGIQEQFCVNAVRNKCAVRLKSQL